MVNRLTRKAIISISKNIAMYGAEMAKLQEKISAIDEKYRKLAEEARKDLVAEYANLEAEQEIWQTSLSRYDAADVSEILGSVDSTALSEEDDETVESTVTEASEQIVDYIFPENNISGDKPAEPDYSMTQEESLSPEEKDIADLWPDPDAQEVLPASEPENAVESEEPVELVEDAPAIDTEPVAAEEVKSKAIPIDLDIKEDEYPEFPEEW